jgi:hypothetical protein
LVVVSADPRPGKGTGGDGVSESFTVIEWTGNETAALRHALRLTVIGFGEYLGVGTRTISKWEARRETITLKPDFQEIMDTALGRATVAQRARFAQFCLEPRTMLSRRRLMPVDPEPQPKGRSE